MFCLITMVNRCSSNPGTYLLRWLVTQAQMALSTGAKEQQSFLSTFPAASLLLLCQMRMQSKMDFDYRENSNSSDDISFQYFSTRHILAGLYISDTKNQDVLNNSRNHNYHHRNRISTCHPCLEPEFSLSLSQLSFGGWYPCNYILPQDLIFTSLRPRLHGWLGCPHCDRSWWQGKGSDSK